MGKELCHYMQLQIEWVTNCAWAECAKKKKANKCAQPLRANQTCQNTNNQQLNDTDAKPAPHHG